MSTRANILIKDLDLKKDNIMDTLPICCTWKDCKQEAIHPQFARDGEQWANLCGLHLKFLEDAMKDHNPRILLSAWIKAQGGAKKAANRV